jgi:metal-responsive CopG/Arc/MetJ family transcriptional regulator
MRVSIDIPDDHIAALNALAKKEHVSRAALVRQAITNLLASRRGAKGDAIAAAFGIWPDMEDGLAYQERLRSEW